VKVEQIRPLLVVEDDESMRELITTLLERAGFACSAAATAEDAIALADREPPTLAILDVDLKAETSGYELLYDLRARWPEMPAIFLSGSRAEPSDCVTGLLLGADDYVVKPFNPDELLARVRRFTSKIDQFAIELTARQREVLGFLANGMSQSQIALRLSLSPSTVASHIETILIRLKARSRAEAVALAHQHGLTNGHETS
jgi:DNA-binding NarL/FixJ family response regulator